MVVEDERRTLPAIMCILRKILVSIAGTPHVVKVQTAPDVEARAVRIVSEAANAGVAPVRTLLKLTPFSRTMEHGCPFMARAAAVF